MYIYTTINKETKQTQEITRIYMHGRQVAFLKVHNNEVTHLQLSLTNVMFGRPKIVYLLFSKIYLQSKFDLTAFLSVHLIHVNIIIHLNFNNTLYKLVIWFKILFIVLKQVQNGHANNLAKWSNYKFVQTSHILYSPIIYKNRSLFNSLSIHFNRFQTLTTLFLPDQIWQNMACAVELLHQEFKFTENLQTYRINVSSG